MFRMIYSTLDSTQVWDGRENIADGIDDVDFPLGRINAQGLPKRRPHLDRYCPSVVDTGQIMALDVVSDVLLHLEAHIEKEARHCWPLVN